MKSCGIDHTEYSALKGEGYIFRLTENGEHTVDVGELCSEFRYISKRTKRSISGELMGLIVAMRLLCGRAKYMIADISEDLFEDIMKNTSLIPCAVILCGDNSDKNELLASLVPKGTQEIVLLTDSINCDYVSSVKNPNGVRISYSSPNKHQVFKGNLSRTEFFYFSELMSISTMDLNNVPLACLAIEAARALFSLPLYTVRNGLRYAAIPQDVVPYSVSPLVFLKTGDREPKFAKGISPRIVREDNFDGAFPDSLTVYVGSAEFIEEIKAFLRSGKNTE